MAVLKWYCIGLYTVPQSYSYKMHSWINTTQKPGQAQAFNVTRFRWPRWRASAHAAPRPRGRPFYHVAIKPSPGRKAHSINNLHGNSLLVCRLTSKACASKVGEYLISFSLIGYSLVSAHMGILRLHARLSVRHSTITHHFHAPLNKAALPPAAAVLTVSVCSAQKR